ncbi:glycosyltransferase family 4 protein [Halogeometricum sp. S1BR25-6]|uniref:Glycosyltransferase family 4 protein n=1 Tax=Halogeometricum salsisoli TaxID=2950536 RepID=A0ABU2GHD5_9EURY|nr:glycosyltransferase family 4 protein [Halogeometricum sp. S1BR25-6]MDS0300242.1 glycosyltransferase family 4 protein [Halogeometricum sp. S1BR25-6]
MRNIGTALLESGWEVDVLSPRSHENDRSGTQGILYHEFPYDDPSSSIETILNTVRGVKAYQNIMEYGDFDVFLDDISHYPYYPGHFFCPEEVTNAIFMHTAFFGTARKQLGPLRGTVIDGIDRTLPLLKRPEIVCAGESTEKRIQQKTGYQKTHILHPTVRASEYEFKFNPNSKTITYLGRLGTRKNVSCLLRAWQKVEYHSSRNLELVIAGSGPQEANLQELAESLRLEDITFAGYVDESEKRQLLSESLLYVLPSTMEGYATSGLEALASGTPVVGSDTFGINDYIEHGRNGYLFPVDDDTQLAELLIDLTSNTEQLQQVARDGRKLAEKHDYKEFRQVADTIFSKLGQSH